LPAPPSAAGRFSIAPSESQLRSVYTVPPSGVVHCRIWAWTGAGMAATTASIAVADSSAAARAGCRRYGIGQGYSGTLPRRSAAVGGSGQPVEHGRGRAREVERVEVQSRRAALDQAPAQI